MDQRIQDEINELEEVVASLVHLHGPDDPAVSELLTEIERLKEIDRQSI